MSTGAYKYYASFDFGYGGDFSPSPENMAKLRGILKNGGYNDYKFHFVDRNLEIYLEVFGFDSEEEAERFWIGTTRAITGEQLI